MERKAVDALIAGLGNPGPKYSGTRHNAGFMLADLAARRWNASPWKLSGQEAASCDAAFSICRVRLIKPLTYMNRSGGPLRSALPELGESRPLVIVAHDDIDLPLGSIKVKSGGGHGGHNGLRSIIEELGDGDFARIRMGVGRPPEGVEAADHVLGEFTPAEGEILNAMLEESLSALETILSEGIEKAMNAFNRKDQDR